MKQTLYALEHKLTHQEKELLPLLVSGLSPKQIAVKIQLHELTVEAFRYVIFRKCQVHTLEQLAQLAKEHGFVK